MAIVLTMLRIHCCAIHRFTFGRTLDCCYSLDSDYRILVTHNLSIVGIATAASLLSSEKISIHHFFLLLFCRLNFFLLVLLVI
jgi:hypothetical protein